MRSAKNSQEGYIDVCSDIMEQYDAGKISSGEALEVIKNCLKNISKIKVLPTALAQLWRNKLPTIATILTVAIVTLLIVITNTVKDTAIEKQVNWINHSGADIIIGGAGATDLIGTSTVSQEQLQTISSTPGVQQAQGFIYYFCNMVGRNGKYLTLTIQSYSPNVGFGGPWSISEGRSLQNSGEIVLDESLKQSLGSSLGQSVTIAGHTYRLVGFSRGTQAFSKQSVFITSDDARSYLTANPYYHFVLVRSDEVSDSLIRLRNQGFNAMTRQDFSNNTKRYWSQEVAPTMEIITFASISLGLVILMLLYTLTFSARKSEIAIMKSAGATNRKIASIELFGLGLSASVGVGLGISMSYLGMIIINQSTAGFDSGLSVNAYLLGIAFAVAILVVAVVPTLVLVAKIKPLLVKKKLYGITLFSLQE